MNATQSDARMKARALKEGKAREKGEQDKKRCEDRNAAAIRLVSQNLAGKAMASLQSDGVAQLSQVTFEKLESKHPEGERPALPESSESPLNTPPSYVLSSDFDISEVIRSFPNNTAGGPSGLRAQHLKDCLAVSIQQDRPFASSLRRFVNLLLSGKIPEEVARFFFGGSLTALLKIKNHAKFDQDDPTTWDVRPICVGETFRRLASKCVCQLVKTRALSIFKGTQYGVAVKGGVEQVIHTVRELADRMQHSEDFVIFKIDFENAFNFVSRVIFIEEVGRLFPEFLPWAQACYACQPVLIHPLGSILSKAGVQQGDPLGPLFFSLVLQIIINKIKRAVPDLLLNLWYLDDGVLAGSVKSVARAFELIHNEGARLGLSLSLKKSELYSSTRTDTTQIMKCFPATLHSHDVPIPPKSIPLRNDLNFVLLGSPIGDGDFCNSFADSAIRGGKKLLRLLEELGDTHTSLHLLSSCCSFGKFNHIIRSTPLSLVESPIADFDNSVVQCLSNLVGKRLTEKARLQATLQKKNSGLGIRSLVRHANAAFVSSSRRFLPGVHTRFLEEALVGLETVLGSAFSRHEENLAGLPLSSQRVLSCRLDEHQLQFLRNACSDADLARINSLCTASAGVWLEQHPSILLDHHIPSELMKIALQMRLGLGLFQSRMFCRNCPTVPLDFHGHHALTCRCASYRHRKVQGSLFSLLRLAHCDPRWEQGAMPGNARRPGDILVTDDFGNDKPLALDVTVPSVQSSGVFSICARDATGLGATGLADAMKMKENVPECEMRGWECVPISIDIYGSFGVASDRFFDKLADRIAAHTRTSFYTALRLIRSKIGLVLAKTNAKIILSAYPILRMDKHHVAQHEASLLGGVGEEAISGSERNEGPNAAQASFSMSSGSGAAGDFISSASPFVIGAS